MVPGFQIYPNMAPIPLWDRDISILPNKLEKGYRKGLLGAIWGALVTNKWENQRKPMCSTPLNHPQKHPKGEN